MRRRKRMIMILVLYCVVAKHGRLSRLRQKQHWRHVWRVSRACL